MSFDKTTAQNICRDDVKNLVRVDDKYGSSWKRRGGVGAFMMLARKWDRIEQILRAPDGSWLDMIDVMVAEATEPPEGNELGLTDQVVDLARYLLLVRVEVERLTQDRRSWDALSESTEDDAGPDHNYVNQDGEEARPRGIPDAQAAAREVIRETVFLRQKLNEVHDAIERWSSVPRADTETLMAELRMLVASQRAQLDELAPHNVWVG